MIYEPTKAISQAMTQRGIRHEILEKKYASMVCARFCTQNAGEISLHFISVNDQPDVSIQVFLPMTIPEHRRAFALEIVNKLNLQYRHLCFALDEDNAVQATCDLPKGCANPGEVACEMCLYMVKTVDQARLAFVTACF